MAGRANVCIFPDLNTGNNTYKVHAAILQSMMMAADISCLSLHLRQQGSRCNSPAGDQAGSQEQIRNPPVVSKYRAETSSTWIFIIVDEGLSCREQAVQQSSGGGAIGPLMQGLTKPVNDLSRGCTVDDVIDTVLCTSVQALAGKGQNPMSHAA